MFCDACDGEGTILTGGKEISCPVCHGNGESEKEKVPLSMPKYEIYSKK